MSKERLQQVSASGGKVTARKRERLGKLSKWRENCSRTRAMGRLGGLALLMLVAVKGGWQVTFTPAYDNVGLEMLIECKQSGYWKPLFEHIDEDSTQAGFTRPLDMPTHQRCTAVLSVLRNPERGTGDPKNDYVGESTIVILPEAK